MTEFHSPAKKTFNIPKIYQNHESSPIPSIPRPIYIKTRFENV